MADDSDDDLVSYRMRPQKPIDPTLMATTCAGMVVLLTGGDGWTAGTKWLVKGLKYHEISVKCRGLGKSATELFSLVIYVEIYLDVFVSL